MKKMKAGRKLLTDKKKLVGVYRKESEIQKLGGMEKVRNIINEHLNKLTNETIN
jgi:hypothetical protein